MSRARAIAAVGLLADIADCDLFDSPRQSLASAALREHQMNLTIGAKHRNRWALIESIVVFDEVLYDSYAFNRFGMTQTQRDRLAMLEGRGLLAMKWPTEIYKATAEKLKSWREITRSEPMDAISRNVPGDPTIPYSSAGNDAYWDPSEKNYHDGLFADSARCQWSFADSSQSFERSFFYAELCADLGIGMLPRAYW